MTNPVRIDHRAGFFHVARYGGLETSTVRATLNVPGARWDKAGRWGQRDLRVPGTWFHAHRLRAALPEAEWLPTAALTYAALQERDEAIARGNGFVLSPARELYPHQETGVQGIALRGFRALLADEMGLGKTAVALETFRECGFRKLLVVCPASVKYNWPKEAAMSGLPDALVIPSGGPARARAIASMHDRPIVVVNWDLIRLKDVLGPLELFAEGAMLVLDESHYAKDWKSARSKAAAVLARRAAGVLLLTGTPIRNTCVDLYHQLDLIDPRLFRNLWEFQDRYAVVHEMSLPGRAKSVRKVVGAKNQAELAELLRGYQIRRLKSEVLNLPPKIRTVTLLEIDRQTKASYEAMRKDWIYHYAGIPDDAVFDVRVQNAMEQALRLEQICQGYLRKVPVAAENWTAFGKLDPTPGPPDLFLSENVKVQWLIELAEDHRTGTAPRKLVVFFKFNRTLQVVGEVLGGLGHQVRGFYGETKPEDRTAILDWFHEGAESKILLAQVKLAEGWNAQCAQTVAFYGRDWSPAVNLQAEDRLHRIGQTGTVSVLIPLVQGSIEEYIHKRLEAKEGDAKSIIDFADVKAAILEGGK